MQVKKKPCEGEDCDGKLQYIWKNVDGKKYCRQCAAKQHTQKTAKPTTTKSEKKRYYHIPSRSTKKEKQDALYSIIRAAYLKAHPNCEAAIPGICSGQPADQIHHKKGKVGDLYLDDKYFLATEFCCHRWIEDHPEEAIQLGFSEKRLAKNEEDGEREI